MPSPGELAGIARELRRYGDIPKIVVRPGSEQDILELLAFTLSAEKPVCTGVQGEAYRYARVILPLFGSELVYTHAGTPGAHGTVLPRRFQEDPGPPADLKGYFGSAGDQPPSGSLIPAQMMDTPVPVLMIGDHHLQGGNRPISPSQPVNPQ